jgi:hypothetical protein
MKTSEVPRDTWAYAFARSCIEPSLAHGLCPAGVIEHTPDGHHPIGWSWGSEWYLADFYLCLTRAIIQRAEKVGLDLKEKPPRPLSQRTINPRRHQIATGGM